MNGHETARDDAPDDAAVATPGTTDLEGPGDAGRGRTLEWHRAETERLRVLVEFLSHPIHAPGGSDPDPDVLTAYNLAVEAALHGVRRAAGLGAARRRHDG